MMKNIVQLIREHRFTEAEEKIDNTVPLIMEKKIFEMKKAVAAKMCEQMGIKTASEKIRGELTEDEKEESPKQTLSKRADNYDRSEVPKATNALATLQTDYGRNSSIGKKAQTAYDSVIAKRDKLEKDAHDARVSQDKDDESSRVKNKLSNAAKGGYLTKDAAEKYIYSAKSNIQGGEYAKRRVSQSEPINEEELDEARINIVRARVRGGKVQRRKKVSNVPGMTFRGGTLKRMSAAERRRRKMGARRGKVKRRAKLSRSLMKRKRSLQKRKSLGL